MFKYRIIKRNNREYFEGIDQPKSVPIPVDSPYGEQMLNRFDDPNDPSVLSDRGDEILEELFADAEKYFHRVQSSILEEDLAKDILKDLSRQKTMIDAARTKTGKARMESKIDPKAGIQTGVLKSGTPGPMIDDSMQNIERRLITDWAEQPDPHTGLPVTVPYMDPMQPTRVLPVESGDSKIARHIDFEGHDRGSEYLVDRVLRTIGVNDLNVSNQQNVAGVDFRGTIPGIASGGIDAEVRYSDGNFGNSLPIQVYTSINPTDRHSNPKIEADEVSRLINKEMDDRKVNVTGAVNQLLRDDKVTDVIPGKSLNKDYQALVMPGFSAARASSNNRKDRNPSMILPDTLHAVNLDAVSKELAARKGRQHEKIRIRPGNKGWNDKGNSRGRLYMDVPLSSGIDLTSGDTRYARVSQLMNMLEYIKNPPR